jgi:hypothetical protein
MDDNSDSSDDDDDHNQLVVLQDNDVEEIEDEEQAAAAAAAAEDDELRTIRHCQIITVLEKKKGFSFRTRNKVDELIKDFLDKIKNDIHTMICDNDIEYREGENRYDDYRGLDSDRDTEEEVETTLRCFPELISLPSHRGFYPIQHLSYAYDANIVTMICNVKAVSYIPLVARLSIEFGLFEEEERGGILLEHRGAMVLSELTGTEMAVGNQEHHELVENKYLLVMKKLRQMGLLKKEDIKGYGLLNNLCNNDVLAEKRFRFVVEWDPTALLLPTQYGSIPLYHAASNSIQGFQLVFEYGIRYYPNKKGINLLFRKNQFSCSTPFQAACDIHGRDKVMRVIEEILILYSSSSDNSTPLNVVDALITAAIDEDIHLDCVYFLLRRQPDVLIKLLSGSSSSCPTSASASASEGDTNGNNNTRDSSKAKKRKRG